MVVRAFGLVALGAAIPTAVMLAAMLRPRLTRAMTRCYATAPAPSTATSATQKVKIALCQIQTTADKAQNIETAVAAVRTAASNGAKLVVLPEMWHCPYSNDSFPTYAEDIAGGTSMSVKAMSDVALETGVTLVGGSIAERSQGKLFNTCCVFSKEGKLLAKHRKVHLFDIDIPGKISFKESLTLTAGSGPTVVDTDAGRLGIGICYDLRFPELSAIYAQRGVQLIVIPGAFNTVTGPLHWELLQRARAVDNQLFVATCSPARSTSDQGYQAWGHSSVISPFAKVQATTGHEVDIVYSELDYAEIEERRTNMPLAKQKRHDLYALVDKTL